MLDPLFRKKAIHSENGGFVGNLEENKGRRSGIGRWVKSGGFVRGMNGLAGLLRNREILSHENKKMFLGHLDPPFLTLLL